MKTMTNVMENKVAVFIFLFTFVSIVDAKRRDRFDIIEKRIGSVETRISIVETRINSDNELAKSLQQNLEELNNSMINFKDQMCPTLHQQTGKEKQTSSAKRVELLKSSRILVSLGLNREKQWTRDQVEKLTGLVNEQTGLLNQNFSELKNEFKRNMNEVSLKSDTTEQLISAQQREIETLKESQANLVNVLISTKLVNYDYTCPPDWTKFSSYCYLRVDEWKTFSEARAHCKRLGATLSDIENGAENTFIGGLARGWTKWIGYTDEKEEGTWISERTGKPASFINFDTSQPHGGTRENCAYMSYISDLWYDASCYNNFTFVCKKDAKMDIKF